MDFRTIYNREEYIRFFRQLFGEEKFIKKDRSAGLHISSKWYFKNIHTLWLVRDLDWLDEDLVILEIEHTSSKDARVALTKELLKLLSNTEIEGTYHTQALVIFTNNQDTTYRMSLFTTTYDRSKGIKKFLSNPRRQSFLLWPWEKTKTPETQFKLSIISFSDLLSRFKVEVVRDEFFNQYIALFVRLYAEIQNDNEFVKFLLSSKISLTAFTKTLLGKIIFLYFIQKKWWLWVEKGASWWTWKKDFMRWLWENRLRITFEKTGNFYNDCLEHLFYDGLNSPSRIHNDDYDLNFKCKIPYLNWWLFKSDYNFEQFESKIANDIFSNNEENGILDVFDLYNFTIDEDDIYDSEIAVDPEMLGKIFEKMISIDDININKIITIYQERALKQKKWDIKMDIENWEVGNNNKKLWAYYTPREIVHYMARESLIAYLNNQLRGSKEQNEVKIRTLFSAKDYHLSKKFDLNNSTDLDVLLSIAEDVDASLRKVKILDPAVGSWAFPMGILHEISTLRYYLHSEWFCNIHIYEDTEWESENFLEDGHLSMYQIKREIIKNSIYGVDIDPWAIDIARLRFWLSLVVDADIPEPLPNFEFKFVCANTLIPLEEEQEQRQLSFDIKELNTKTIKGHMIGYYDAKEDTQKEKFKRLLENYLGFWKNLKIDFFKTRSPRTKQLETYEPFNPNHSAEFFDPSLMMWNSKFDIVIGNPPYISSWNMWDSLKKFYTDEYKTAVGHYDLYVLFYEKWINLLKKNWNLNFITSNKFLSQKYGLELRKLLLQNLIRNIISFNFDIFENATVDTCIIIVERKELENNYIKVININEKDDYESFINKKYWLINQNLFRDIENYLFRLDLSQEENRIIEKIKHNSVKLEEICYIDCGIVVHSEAKWMKKDDFIHEHNSNNDLKIYVEWKNIQRYFLKGNSKYIDYQPLLHHRPKFAELFKGEKILIKDISWSTGRLICALDNDSYVDQSIRILVPLHFLENVNNKQISSYMKWKDFDLSRDFDIKYILSILLSRLLWFYFEKYLSDNLHISPHQIRSFPIKKIPLENQDHFIERVDKIMHFTKQHSYDFKKLPVEQIIIEREIDILVFRLYGLTVEEIAVVAPDMVLTDDEIRIINS